MPESAFSKYSVIKKKQKKRKEKRDSKLHKVKKLKRDENRTENHQSVNNLGVSVPPKPKKKLKLKSKKHVEAIVSVKQKKVHENGVKLKKKKKKKIEVVEEEIPQLVEPQVFPLVNSRECPPRRDFPRISLELIKWLLYPMSQVEFFENYWEQDPLYISRNAPEYYSHLLTTNDLDIMLKENPLHFGRNVDIVKYIDGERITDNPSGRARSSLVWDAYASGYSIRILNPQTYNSKIHMVLSTLQEYFGTMVGVNVYLTPAGSQGFAPHYDDIEAFVLQLEGRKHWKLYKPKNENDNLARFSSKDFTRDDLGELIAECTLNAGDLLYFPRGMVHEAKTDDEKHSLHITISTYQRTSYADLLEKMLPETLNYAATQDIEFRKGLPLNYLKYLGVANSEVDHPNRTKILGTFQSLMMKLSNYATIDSAADQMGRKFIHEALPPVLSEDESLCTSHGGGNRLDKGELVDRVEIEPDTEVRLIRYYSIRLVIEDNKAILYYCTDNAQVYHGEEEQYMELDMELCPIIDMLLKKYPNFITVEDLPVTDMDKKMQLITDLWDYGIVMTNEPLPTIE